MIGPFCTNTLTEIAKKAGTPCYVYSADAIRENYRAYDRAFGDAPHTVCYAVKANGNLAILSVLAQEGAGFDLVSGGELFRVLKAGGDPAKIVFSGVGKTATEIDEALRAGIFTFNCESEPELALVDALASRLGVRARVALRVNPNVDAATHAYISTGSLAHKFGVDIGEAECVYHRAREFSNLVLEGVSCHIGSQLMNIEPVMQAVELVAALGERLRAQGFPIGHLDLGGGLAVAYKAGEEAPTIASFIAALCGRVANRGFHLVIEPGRSIVGGAGLLLTRVLYRKRNGEKEFVVVDAAMNDLIRPALYSAHHEIVALRETPGPRFRADVVGPVCETGDFLARDRELPNLLPGDTLAVLTAGAYGFAQSSNYNARPRAAEVLIDGTEWRVVRERESYDDLIRGE
jgi:diaminopimelate decarboxylase